MPELVLRRRGLRGVGALLEIGRRQPGVAQAPLGGYLGGRLNRSEELLCFYSRGKGQFDSLVY